MKRGMAPLLITFMFGTSVFAANKNAELEITNEWKKSSEYKKYISLGGDSSNEAKQLMSDSITEITKQKLQIYLNLLEQSKKGLIEGQIDKFKPWAKVLLLDLNKRIIESIGEDETKKIAIDIYKFVQSVNNFSGRSTLLLDNITNKYPNIKNNSKFMKIYGTRINADIRKSQEDMIKIRQGS